MSRIFFALALIALPASAFADQDPSPAAAGSPAAAQPAAVRQPPTGSGPVIFQTELRFHPINESIIEAQTYLYYIQTPLSRPSENVWVPYNEQTEESLRADFKRLWATISSTTCGLKSSTCRSRTASWASHHLPHGRAASREDRGLHRVDKARAHQGRREDERAGHPAAARLVPRSIGGQARAGHCPRLDGGKGLRIRGSDADR